MPSGKEQKAEGNPGAAAPSATPPAESSGMESERTMKFTPDSQEKTIQQSSQQQNTIQQSPQQQNTIQQSPEQQNTIQQPQNTMQSPLKTMAQPRSSPPPPSTGSSPGKTMSASVGSSSEIDAVPLPPGLTMQDLSNERLLLSAPRTQSHGMQCPTLNGIPLLAKIGQGGMGAVYYGVHPRLRNEVAVKVLPFQLAEQRSGHDPALLPGSAIGRAGAFSVSGQRHGRQRRVRAVFPGDGVRVGRQRRRTCSRKRWKAALWACRKWMPWT